MSIHDNIQSLDLLLDKLESEDINLDDAVKHYAKGVKLAEKTLKDLSKLKTSITELEVPETR